MDAYFEKVKEVNFDIHKVPYADVFEPFLSFDLFCNAQLVPHELPPQGRQGGSLRGHSSSGLGERERNHFASDRGVDRLQHLHPGVAYLSAQQAQRGDRQAPASVLHPGPQRRRHAHDFSVSTIVRIDV